MKTCITCKIEKPFSDFYCHKKMSDGYLGKCKECQKKATKKNYVENFERIQEYEKKRALKPHRVEMRKQYAKSASGIKSGNMAKMKWDKSHPIQRGAVVMVGNAVRGGRLLKPKNCSNCGKETKRLEGHHDDYAKPLSVRWLCPKCHYDWHELNEPINGDK